MIVIRDIHMSRHGPRRIDPEFWEHKALWIEGVSLAGVGTACDIDKVGLMFRPWPDGCKGVLVRRVISHFEVVHSSAEHFVISVAFPHPGGGFNFRSLLSRLIEPRLGAHQVYSLGVSLGACGYAVAVEGLRELGYRVETHSVPDFLASGSLEV